MQATRVALVQLAWPGERAPMLATYESLIAQAVEAGAALVCLPEFSLSPYFPGTTDPQGFAWAEPLHGGESDSFFSGLAARHHIAIISSIFEKADDDTLYDTAVLHDANGVQAGFTRKVHIPSGVGYYETHFFGGDHEFPVHSLAGLNVAAPTCYDQWFPELARIYALNGAEFIFYPTAIGSEPTDPNMDTAESWQTVMRGHAVANGVYIGAANRVGEENGVTFYGSSFICDPSGRVLAQAGRDTTEVIIADLDPAFFAHWRELFPLIHQRRPQIYGRILDRAEGSPSRADIVTTGGMD